MYLSDASGRAAHYDPIGGLNTDLFARNDVFGRIARYEYPSVADQLAYPLDAMTRDQAAFLYFQKALSRNPLLDSASYYRSRIDNSSLVKALSEEAEGIKNADVDFQFYEQLQVDGGICDGWSRRVVYDGSPASIHDGSDPGDAYHSDARCVWAVASDLGCVRFNVTRLASEAPDDALEVFDGAGYLLGRFSGRHGAAYPALRGCADVDRTPGEAAAIASDLAGFNVSVADLGAVNGPALYVRWTSDGYDEHAIGRAENAGFAASVAAVRRYEMCVCYHGSTIANTRGVGSCECVCDAGWSGAQCDAPYCLGAVDQRAGDFADGVLRSQPSHRGSYEANSGCAFYIGQPEGYTHIRLTWAHLATEGGFDFVRIYRGMPVGFASFATLTADDYVFSASGSDAPDDLIVAAPEGLVVAFTSDGIVNAAADEGGGGLAADGGFEIHWDLLALGQDDCPVPCENGRPTESGGSCTVVVDAGALLEYDAMYAHPYNQVGTVRTVGFSLPAARECVCETGYYGLGCTFRQCVGEVALSGMAVYGGPDATATGDRASWVMGPAYSGVIASGVSDDYDPATTCLWTFPLWPGYDDVARSRDVRRVAGLALKFLRFDLEDTETVEELASTFDAVDVFYLPSGTWNPGSMVDAPALVATYDANALVLGFFGVGETLNVDLPAPAGGDDGGDRRYVAVRFRSDRSNPDPRSGFELAYAPRWVADDAGDVDFCDDEHWTCEGDAVCAANNQCVGPGAADGTKGGAVDPVAVAVPVIAIIILGAFVFHFYRGRIMKQLNALSQNLESLEAELQDFKDSVVGVKVAAKDYVPAAFSLDDGSYEDSANSKYAAEEATASRPAAAAADDEARAVWLWREDPARLGGHDAARVKQPHWVMYANDVSAAIERAHDAYLGLGLTSGTDVGDDYAIDFVKMAQTNKRTGFTRDVRRDSPSAHAAAAPPKKAGRAAAASARVHPAAPPREADTSKRPDELLGEDALLLRTGSMVQISKQRPDGWAYGTVLLRDGDAAADRGYAAAEGVSLDTGWFPLAVTDVPTVEQLGVLQKALGGNDGLKPPDEWAEVKDPLVAQFFPLRDGPEKARVVDEFLSTLDAKRFTIVSVERIQNVGAWQSFAVKRRAVFRREADEAKQAQRFERRLWHGTNIEVLHKIVQQGFNRSFCGKNATFYGKGVYFARDASYSTNKTYAVPDAKGVQHMFWTRVVVGEYCKGVKDALTPDVRSGLDLFDTTVNNVADPAIFVTYHDAQAYPEYLIKFRQEGVDQMRGAYSQSKPQPQQPRPAQAVAPAPQQQQQQRLMQVIVPPNCGAGTTLQVQAPDGHRLQVSVPAGAMPGSSLSVAY